MSKCIHMLEAVHSTKLSPARNIGVKQPCINSLKIFTKNTKSTCWISRPSKKFDIKFPPEMIDFYLQYNSAEIYPSKIEVGKDSFQVLAFCPIRYSFHPFVPSIEDAMIWNRGNNFIDPKMIQFAVNSKGKPRSSDFKNLYLCDSTSGEVYLTTKDDITNPIKICDSFNEFLSRLSVCDGDDDDI